MAKRKNRKNEIEKEVPVYNPFENSMYMDFMDIAEDIQFLWEHDRFETALEGYTKEGDTAFFVNLFRKEEIEYEGFLYALKQTLLHEDEAMEIILKKLMTNRQSAFISSAAIFLLLCENDPCEWIMANYDDMASPLAQSFMCLVLGVRGKGKYRLFLEEEADRMLFTYPEEEYHIAAMIGVLGGEE